MAKKNKKNNEVLPEGMSRRQAKLAARAAERAALDRDPRPYGGLAAEADLVALQEFVPSAVAKLDITGVDRDVYVATVLPGGGPAMVRDNGDAFVALQTQSRSHNPGRDLAYALAWVKDAAPGSTLDSAVADGSEPKLTDLIAADAELEITEHQDFNWWFPEDSTLDAMTAQALQTANDAVVESHRVNTDVPGAVWWIDPGERAHIRWIRREDERPLLDALARVHAADRLSMGEGTKFAGVFRTDGVLVPVWDLDNTVDHGAWGEVIADAAARIEKALASDAPLTADERKSRDTIVSRQVTIR